jgi:dnd system-associated protein 4
MIEFPSERETVAIDSAVHDTYKQLTEGNMLDAPFKSMKDVFMWAVCLGAQLGTKQPLTSKRTTIFRWAQFDPQVDVPLLKAIAITDSDDTSILLKRNDILTIAEEYANAGIHELRALMMEEVGRPLWNVVSKITQANN